MRKLLIFSINMSINNISFHKKKSVLDKQKTDFKWECNVKTERLESQIFNKQKRECQYYISLKDSLNKNVKQKTEYQKLINSK